MRVINENKLKIDFGRIIGEVKNTMVHHRKILLGGIIHIDKNGGAHIVPAFPDKFKGAL
ncbi:hypothetical protein CVT00_01385 [Campylobacter concisus]|uniref:Bacterial toxin 50 domain-containing protein n=1 Tax=Campylobacter concisus TaxID=199 RepID=A0A7S9WRW6_9BACT|nr:hypothetical protein CVT00_01385 [Campylobacter concisus]